MKCSSALLAASMLCCAARVEAMRRAAVAPPAPANLVVDGLLDDWNLGVDGAAPPITLSASTSQLESGAIKSDADHSAQIFVTHGASSLMIAALVTDDHVVSTFHAGEIWRGDLVEVLLARPGDPAYLHVGVSPSGEVWVFGKGPSAAALHLRAAGRIGPPGYIVELEIPFAAFGASPRASSLQVNFGARDVDPGEDPPAHRCWSGERHQAVGTFGTLVLVGRDVWPPAAARAAPWPTCPKPAERIAVDAPIAARGRTLVAGTRPLVLRLVNYQSASRSWAEFWTRWDAGTVDHDLTLAEKLGANAIRVFVFTEEFGDAHPKPSMVARLSALVDLARRHGILTVVTFFPFKKDFRAQSSADMEAHLRGIVSQFRDDPGIAMWDLMNEADHGWALPDAPFKNREVRAWGEHMAAAVRAADPTHLVTVGLAGHFAHHSPPVDPDELVPTVDVLSLHWFFDLAELRDGLKRAQAALAVPVVLQEFGVTNLYASEREAAEAYASACAAASEAQLAGFGAWELYDHPVGSIAWVQRRFDEIPENHFGLLRSEGSAKPAAAVFCRCMAAPALRIGRAP